MPLATAPCPKCQTLLVFGQRQCRRCGEQFDYGPTPPPEPTVEQMREALAYAQWQAGRQAAAQAPGAPQAPVAQQAPAPQAPVQPQVPVQPQAPVQPHAAGYAPQAAAQAQTPGYPPQAPAQAQTPGYPPQMHAPPPAAPTALAAPADDLIDRGRFDDAAAAPVQPEEIPGFIDSSLFAAYTPKEVAVERIDGLETTAVEEPSGGGWVAVEPAGPVELTSYGEVGEVQAEEIPGFIDSSLFAAYTPATVETEAVDGLELSPSAYAARAPKRARTGVEEDGEACSDCGARHERVVCPSCGARRRSAD